MWRQWWQAPRNLRRQILEIAQGNAEAPEY
jgi:hypothetical protein